MTNLPELISETRLPDGRVKRVFVVSREREAPPKRERKTRAAPATKATINRHIDIALARGLPVKGILPDGTVAIGSVDNPKIAVADEPEIVL